MPVHHGIEDSYALTPVQEGILFHTLLTQRSEEHCDQVIVDIAGELDAGLFRRAWHRVIERHAALRTSFAWEDIDEPLQFVHRSVEIDVRRLDWRDDQWGNDTERIESFLDADRLHEFSLSHAPLMRLILIAAGKQRHLFVWSFHHAILDNLSVSLVLGELFFCYRAYLRSVEPALDQPRPFKEYVAYIRDFKDAGAEKYWRTKLSGCEPGETAFVQPRRDVDSSAAYYRNVERKLPAEMTRDIDRFRRRHGLSVGTLVQGAWSVLLGRYRGRRDVVFGSVLPGRSVPLEGIESMVGVCENTVPLRILLPRRACVRDWLPGVREDETQLLRYGATPLVAVHEYAGVPAGRQIFDTIVAIGNQPDGRLPPNTFDDLDIVSIRHIQRTRYPLTLIACNGSRLLLDCAYDRRRFRKVSVERMLEHMEHILEEMIIRPDASLSSIRMLSTAERRALTDGINESRVDFGRPICLHNLFGEQVERTPDRIAVSADSQVTYRSLDERANRLAHHLVQNGVGPDRLVGICIDRSVELVVAILGILKAGGAYVPLNPEYPRERLSFIVNDSKVSLVLAGREQVETVSPLGITVLTLDADNPEFYGERPDNPAVPVAPANLAYMAYTSGSTGVPKGAMNTHEGISNRLRWMKHAYRLGGEDHLLQKTPFDFDVSVWELFWPLITGARLVMAVPGMHGDSGYLVRAIAGREITALHFVPSMLQAFLEEEWNEECRSVTDVFCSGEALTPELRDRFFRRFDARLHNLYGPVEAAVEVTFWHCERDTGRFTVPIGRPLPNVTLYVLDDDLEPVPACVVGELYIGGIAIARGYLDRPVLTACRFVPDPFGMDPGSRIYRTGDRAWIGEDGVIEFSGRIDNQVKIRGFRVEPGEIEAVMMRHPVVRQAVVTAREDMPGDVRLVCYLTPRRNRAPAIPDLRRFLADRLPIHMMPSFFIVLDRFPLLPSGKVNRRSLPAPERVRPETEREYESPRTPVEELLADIWIRVLGITRIGVHDDFFELGGHSILATRVVSQVRRAFHVDLPLRTVFERATIAELAETIGSMEGDRHQSTRESEPVLGRRERLLDEKGT